MESLDEIPLAYATCSIGCKPEHTLLKRLDAIAGAGFQAIELSMPDLVTFANDFLKPRDHGKDEIDSSNFDDLCSAAKQVRSLCEERGLQIMMLQPFANFEGWPDNSAERADAWTRVEGWTKIMLAAGIDLLQVGSSDSPAEKIGTDRTRFVNDLRALADHLAKHHLRVAYDNTTTTTQPTHIEDVWDICKQVDRDNFGLCLDTFQSAGGEWGDPTTQSGLIEDGRIAEQVAKDWKDSCGRLSETVPKEKIYLLQISDAYKPPQPLENKEVDGLRPRGRWSHDFRPLPFDGYLPVTDFAEAVLKTGFRGWFSYEVFDGGPTGKGKDYELVPYAKRAREVQRKLVEACASRQ